MASVWFAKDGNNPTRGEPFRVVPLAECETTLGLTARNYITPLSKAPRFSPDSRLGAYTRPRHVVVEVDEKEAQANGWKPGFYYLPELSPALVERRLA